LEPGHPTIVCGDFNSPKAELADGTVLPFARARNARARLAEERLMGSTTAAGLRDVYRAVWGYDRQESSWYWKNRGRTGGFRLDHIFASPSLVADRCEYVHDFRTRGLSDHSPIFADFPGLQLA
jgi:exonuclease III